MPTLLVVVAFGASAGAIIRWALSAWLNGLYPPIPIGTLASNLIGGYLVGIAVAVFAAWPGLSPMWRMLLVTGFLGGLTTFSTFSAEVVANLLDGRLLHAFAAVAAHVLGSLVCTVLGIATVRWLNGTPPIGG
ncbi:MAG: fluoride efflux transporter CrcB [Roseateles depolymerans]|uniref:Fluoride-specific ion channel FluC n=1 Tax=Roseateles depolymerans TaxID=76731 RepID=A0A2W5DA19_9BURK|nr:MAG: fluoride efflux transporter CrcB [Roseateles depolymerans]